VVRDEAFNCAVIAHNGKCAARAAAAPGGGGGASVWCRALPSPLPRAASDRTPPHHSPPPLLMASGARGPNRLVRSAVGAPLVLQQLERLRLSAVWARRGRPGDPPGGGSGGGDEGSVRGGGCSRIDCPVSPCPRITALGQCFPERSFCCSCLRDSCADKRPTQTPPNFPGEWRRARVQGGSSPVPCCPGPGALWAMAVQLISILTGCRRPHRLRPPPPSPPPGSPRGPPFSWSSRRGSRPPSRAPSSTAAPTGGPPPPGRGGGVRGAGPPSPGFPPCGALR